MMLCYSQGALFIAWLEGFKLLSMTYMLFDYGFKYFKFVI